MPLVSVLFITYKRIDKLERALFSFRQHTDYPLLEIVIADDGSPAEMQQRIRRLPADVFALLPKNKGLGANNNNGIRHCSGKYILMVQDDWECCGPSQYLKEAVSVMEANPHIGLINFAGAPHPVDSTTMLEGSNEPCYVTPEPYANPLREEFLYSDQPHLISRVTQDFIGAYIETPNMDLIEADYERRFKSQDRYSAASFPAYYLKAFVDISAGESVRKQRLRHRVTQFFYPAKPFIEKHAYPLYLAGKFAISRTMDLFEHMGFGR